MSYKEALEAIADFEPEWIPWHHPDKGCLGCVRARERKWPPSGLCDKHYSPMANNSDANKRARAMQYLDLKDIARKALRDGDSE